MDGRRRWPKNATRTLEITTKVNVLTPCNKAEIISARAADPDSTPGNGSTTEEDDDAPSR